MKTLYLIDGHAQFFRAFHAIRTPMSSPVTKEPTNATYGFVGMFLKMLRELKPDFVAVAIDVGGDTETFRSELYPEYKQNRDAMPEALRPQIGRCVSVLEEMGVPVIGVPGFEADDVLATIATRLKDEAGEEVRIRLVSKDKDLQQLLEAGRVEMFDVHSEDLMDVDRLKEEKKITPEQVIDMLALMGDTVDNVPGVDGVGPKTAAQLIEQYGTLENLLEHAGEIKGKRGEKIRAAAEHLPLSKTLVTLRHDVPLDFDLASAQTSGFGLERLLPVLKELGFNRYQEDVRAMVGGEDAADEDKAPKPSAQVADGLFSHLDGDEPVRAAKGDYKAITTKKALDALVKTLKGAEVFAFDTETTSLSPMRAELCGVSVSAESGTGFYIPTMLPEGEKHLSEEQVLGAIGPLLEDPERAKCGHNLKYDMLVLRRCGIEVRGAGGKLFDSMVSSFLIDSARSSHSMDNLAMALLGRSNIPISELIGKGKHQRTFDTVTLDRATPYASEDADVSLQLHDTMAPQVRAMKLSKLFEDLEMPLVEVLAELEWNGIIVDPEELGRQEARLNTRIEELRSAIADASPHPFNPDSPKQLSQALFNAPDAEPPGLGIKPIKKTKTGFSTDVEVLEKLAQDPAVESEVPQLIVEYRQLTKLVGTYLSALKDEINPETKRVHSSFNQTGAATGRLSSSDPNLQNIPIRTDIGREIRKAFVAPEGSVLIGADYSQIELRLLAHLSRDPELIKAFDEDQDIHTAVAAQIHGVALDKVTKEQRNGAKMVNFGIVYGITPFGLARRLGIENAEATEIIDSYKKRFSGIATFLQECIDQAQRMGYVETMMGRRRAVSGIGSRNPNERSMAERVAINSVVQGSAADLIKLAMVDLHARLSEHASHRRGGGAPEIPGVKMLLQIHDELVFEATEDVAAEARSLIEARMEAAMELRVPLKVEGFVGKNWFEGK